MRRTIWAGVLLLTLLSAVLYALYASPFSGMYGLADRERDLRGARVPFFSALHWGMLEFALIMFAAWLGATARENAAFLNLQPLSRTGVVLGRLGFGVALLGGLVLVAMVAQGVVMPTPASWMERSEVWWYLGLDSVMVFLEACFVFGLATLLSSRLPMASASLVALTPVLADYLLRPSGEGAGGFWATTHFYTYLSVDLVRKGATSWLAFITANEPQRILLTAEMPMKLSVSALLAVIVLVGAFLIWSKRTHEAWNTPTTS
ncbi:hypothetical protein [Deinococcus peraridilitoris]|nr:hypothetical protein [Deinococcus peraridilitoris]